MRTIRVGVQVAPVPDSPLSVFKDKSARRVWMTNRRIPGKDRTPIRLSGAGICRRRNPSSGRSEQDGLSEERYQSSFGRGALENPQRVYCADVAVVFALVCWRANQVIDARAVNLPQSRNARVG